MEYLKRNYNAKDVSRCDIITFNGDLSHGMYQGSRTWLECSMVLNRSMVIYHRGLHQALSPWMICFYLRHHSMVIYHHGIYQGKLPYMVCS